MKQIFKRKLFIITFSVLLGMLLVPSLVFAVTAESISGTAEVVSTGGVINFDEFNSNAVVDPQTGAVSGFVWSEDLGWIDFGNSGEANSVMVDLDSGLISGLAYVLNTGGQIDFSNYNSNVVWNSESGNLSGYGWSEDLGWIDFSGALLTLPETGMNIFPILAGAVFLIGISVFILRRNSKIMLQFNIKG